MSGLLNLLEGNNGQRAEWIRAHLDYPNKDWCLIWPFSRSDTGYALFGSPPRKVSRIMCERRHGPPPTPEHHAAHSCDRGHEACVNPWHLDWKTPADNQLDRRRNGKTPPRKLTPDQALEIRNLKGLEHTKNTAARYGIRESNVRLIQSGKTWREEAKDRYFLSDADVLRIRAASREPSVVKALAAEYSVSTSTICRVRDRKSYQFVEDSEPTPLQPASPHCQAVNVDLGRLIDWVYLYATEGSGWPDTKTVKDPLIALATKRDPTQEDADCLKACGTLKQLLALTRPQADSSPQTSASTACECGALCQDLGTSGGCRYGVVGEESADQPSNAASFGNSPKEIQKRAMKIMSPQSQAVCAPKVPWKGSLSVDLRKGALAVNANGVTLIDEAGTCWAIVFPDKNGFYDHAATIAAALTRPERREGDNG